MNRTTWANDITTELLIIATSCPDCGVVYGIGKEFRAERRKDNRTFYCPNGHSIWFAPPKVSEADRLREQLEASRSLAQWERERRETAERSAIAYKGVATRVKNRAALGVCPVPGCRRSFANVARHVAGQHPDFMPHDGAPS